MGETVLGRRMKIFAYVCNECAEGLIHDGADPGRAVTYDDVVDSDLVQVCASCGLDLYSLAVAMDDERGAGNG